MVFAMMKPTLQIVILMVVIAVYLAGIPKTVQFVLVMKEENQTLTFHVSTHHLGMNYYVKFLGRLGSNGIQLK